MEAKLHLEGMEGEMTTQFDLTRTRMEATIKESEVKLKEEGASVQLQYGNEKSENGSLHNERMGENSRPSTRSGRWVELLWSHDMTNMPPTVEPS